MKHQHRSHRSLQNLWSCLCPILGIFCAIGCGDGSNDSTASSIVPSPSLVITNPTEGACITLHDDPGLTIRVHISIENWLLRPYGYCGTVYSNCGFAVFFVDNQEVMRSSALVTDVPFAELASPTGTHRLRAELRNDADAVAEDADGDPVEHELQVITANAAEACPQ